MLSIILYGRNDHHGYNYHKRFAISLNCIAEVLSSPSDEILFVDYNTPDDEPTIIESLQDTLTEKTKSHLKVIRVRNSHHRLLKSPLSVCEPIARNVALRKSNPNNRWILSTNIDIIFVPFFPQQTLSEMVEELPDGFYQLPRFEIPENLWELKFNRYDPQGNITFLRELAKSLHLNTVARREDFRLYDNPGDFQLMLRRDIFQIGGFDERMQQGWHVDSNLSKRMFLLYEGKIHSLEDRLAGYHCNHTRKSSLFHSKYRVENDWGQFVQNVDSPIANQSSDWGLVNEEIEEIQLGSGHVDTVLRLADGFEKEGHEIILNQLSYNKATYPLSSVFTHLVDHLCHLPNKSTIAYIGHNLKLVALLEQYFLQRKLECYVLKNPNVKELYKQASLIIFDFEEGATIQRQFLKVVKLEKEHRKNIKFIGMDVLHTDFRTLFQHHLSLLTSSYVGGIIYGFIEPKKKRARGKIKGLKRRALFTLHYLLVRYASKKIKDSLYQTKIAKKFAKF